MTRGTVSPKRGPNTTGWLGTVEINDLGLLGALLGGLLEALLGRIGGLSGLSRAAPGPAFCYYFPTILWCWVLVLKRRCPEFPSCAQH